MRIGKKAGSLAALVLVLVCALLAVACGSSTTGPGAAAPADGELGSLAAVCHDAETPNVADSDRGVTADQIQVTTIADANSSLIPQLNQELWDASGVFVSWCNALGGINGRRIVMVEGDARLTQYTEAISRACLESFALVGGGGLFDDLGQRDRVAALPALRGHRADHLGRAVPAGRGPGLPGLQRSAVRARCSRPPSPVGSGHGCALAA